MAGMKTKAALATLTAGTIGLAARDMIQRRHTLKRNFPVVANLRYLLEMVGPELRQYIVASNDEERPFSRDQRTWVYASSKRENNYFGFGTDNDMEQVDGYPIFKHRTFSDVAATSSMADAEHVILPSAKVLGGPRGRRHAFRPQSVVNISGMSYGSLSGNAIMALNSGAKQAGIMHCTGEGSLSKYHRQGGDLIFQIGTAYFGCRDENGCFDMGKLKELCASAPVRAIEIKLSQGAKPGLGGHLPAEKITDEIATSRGIPKDRDCISPPRHSEFNDVDSMLDFVEWIADETGLPVGIKSAIGSMGMWEELAEKMRSGERGVDFIVIDGGEGGTGAAPLVFSDAVALPFRLGFSRVYGIFAEAGVADQVTWVGSGKLGLPENALVAFAMGVDMIHVAREAMLAIGCIQAQRCHTDHCPTGVATQNPWLTRGLDPTLKANRLNNYIRTLRRDLLKVSEACGVWHPGLLTVNDVDILTGHRDAVPLGEVYQYKPGWGVLSEENAAAIVEIMAATAPHGETRRRVSA